MSDERICFARKLLISSDQSLCLAVIDLLYLKKEYGDLFPSHFLDDIEDFCDEVLSFQNNLEVFASVEDK